MEKGESDKGCYRMLSKRPQTWIGILVNEFLSTEAKKDIFLKSHLKSPQLEYSTNFMLIRDMRHFGCVYVLFWSRFELCKFWCLLDMFELLFGRFEYYLAYIQLIISFFVNWYCL